MFLSQREIEKLLLSWAAELARRRKAKGIKLNYPEAVALISDFIIESAREGKRMDEIISESQNLLSEEDVMPEVPDMIDILQVEATFPDGTKLVTVRNPIKGKGKERVKLGDDDIEVQEQGEVEITVRNTGDKPIQVGSHYHFFEVNKALFFDREKALGMRLDIPSGTSVRFEPGEEKKVKLTRIKGKTRIVGLNGLTEGSPDHNKGEAMRRARERGFA
ncbi:urease subunit gamma [Sulfuracidifex tepidarius]|uniref:urease n=1 Tax=Sulfuracidifex tepidarius TaxID=1294262 RepID=A0A510E0C9_9CREN|nr:urease subunit gamma [Sulfuracidifex tepidarius]BBG25887.1 Urease subunit alpha [Sulfuracidifex tepidarius]